MKTRKGVSVVVSWVLLVGLSLTMGILVTTWTKQHVKDIEEDISQDIETDLLCGDVSLKAFVANPPCDNINITNTGYHTIIKVSLRHQFGLQDIDLNLLPTESKVLNILIPTKIEIIPFVQAENKLSGCTEKKVVLTC